MNKEVVIMKSGKGILVPGKFSASVGYEQTIIIS